MIRNIYEYQHDPRTFNDMVNADSMHRSKLIRWSHPTINSSDTQVKKKHNTDDWTAS